MKFVKCELMHKEGVGEIHLHQRWWSTRLAEVVYIPEGREITYQVPIDRLSEFVSVTTIEQAMAVLRR